MPPRTAGEPGLGRDAGARREQRRKPLPRRADDDSLHQGGAACTSRAGVARAGGAVGDAAATRSRTETARARAEACRRAGDAALRFHRPHQCGRRDEGFVALAPGAGFPAQGRGSGRDPQLHEPQHAAGPVRWPAGWQPAAGPDASAVDRAVQDRNRRVEYGQPDGGCGGVAVHLAGQHARPAQRHDARGAEPDRGRQRAAAVGRSRHAQGSAVSERPRGGLDPVHGPRLGESPRRRRRRRDPGAVSRPTIRAPGSTAGRT